MNLNDFIGKTVINTTTGMRHVLYRITAPEIGVRTEKPETDGHYTFRSFPTINGDPFENGYLVFEDTSLEPKFRQAYDAYCRTKDAYWENYGYWLRRD